MTSLKERAIALVVEQLGVAADKITEESHFYTDLGADSLDQVELIMIFEEEFDLMIPDADAEQLQTFGQLLNYVDARINRK